MSKKELGYLKGLFVGDGYKYHDKKSRKYYIEFYLNSTKDKNIINYLTSILRKAGLNIHFHKDKRFNCIRLRIVNKEFFKLFDKNVNKLHIVKGEKLGFISGIIDSEGYVSREKHFIEIVNTDLKLIKFLHKELDSLGINSLIRRRVKSIKDKSHSYRLYISVSFKRLKHLSVKAGINHNGLSFQA